MANGYRCPQCKTTGPLGAPCPDHPGLHCVPIALLPTTGVVDPDVGRRFGDYLTVRLLGIGGMGKVLEARDLRLKRRVAIKVLTGHFHLIRREAQALTRLESPHIVKAYDFGESEGQPWLALEFIDGGNLTQCRALLTPEDKRSIVAQVGEGLADAHQADLLHRDIKPDNIMLQRLPSGRWFARLVDFGIAKDLSAGAGTDGSKVMGTARYMAPEHMEGRPLGPEADIYAFAQVVIELVTGRRLFDGLNDLQVYQRKLQPELALDGVPGPFHAPVLKALACNPAERPILPRLLSSLDAAFAAWCGQQGIAAGLDKTEPPTTQPTGNFGNGQVAARVNALMVPPRQTKVVGQVPPEVVPPSNSAAKPLVSEPKPITEAPRQTTSMATMTLGTHDLEPADSPARPPSWPDDATHTLATTDVEVLPPRVPVRPEPGGRSTRRGGRSGGQPPPNHLLTQRELNELHQHAVHVGLDKLERRDLLFGGIDRGFVSSLPRISAPSDQLLSDLNQLNLTAAVVGHREPPLVIWLENAAHVLRHLPAARPFEERAQMLRRQLHLPASVPIPYWLWVVVVSAFLFVVIGLTRWAYQDPPGRPAKDATLSSDMGLEDSALLLDSTSRLMKDAAVSPPDALHDSTIRMDSVPPVTKAKVRPKWRTEPSESKDQLPTLVGPQEAAPEVLPEVLPSAVVVSPEKPQDSVEAEVAKKAAVLSRLRQEEGHCNEGSSYRELLRELQTFDHGSAAIDKFSLPTCEEKGP